MGTRRRGPGVVSAVVVLGVAGPLGGGGCEPAPCEAPFRPVAAQYTYPGGPPAGEWPVTGVARPDLVTVFDSDGDGVADTWDTTDDGQGLTIHRSSGDLTITVPAPAAIAAYEWSIALGDLDGDGRTEIQVSVTDDPAAPSPTVRHHVVPGRTPDGTHALADVVVVPTDASTYLQPVGDVDGDGRGDVVASYFVDTTRLWLGADLDLDAGAGAPPVPPSHVLEGSLYNPVLLDPATGRTALNLQLVDDDGYPFVEWVLWVPQGSLRFSTEGSGVSPVSPSGAVSIVDGDTTWVVLRVSGRGGETRWAWDAADLCATPGLALTAPGA